jgi:vacuolar protein sorting-associated protein VTA1
VGTWLTVTVVQGADEGNRQTADTFLAAATFLELCQIWGELDPEVSAKIKFAKYHAVRIAKAVKVGEDPNLSNPVQEPEEEQPGLALDLNDPEVQALNGSGEPTPEKQTRQPSVVEVPDEHDQLQRNLARKSLLDESIHPSRASSVPRPSEPQHHATPPPPAPISLPPDDESFYHPVASNTENGGLPSASQMDRTMSAGGGYFPEVPDVAHPSPPPGLPSAPSFHPSSPPGPYIPDVPSLPPGSESPVSPQLPTFPGTTMPPPAPPGAPQAPSPFPQPHSNYAPQPPAPAPYPPSNQSFNATPGPGPNTWSQPPVQYQALPQAYPPQRTAQPPPAVASPRNIVVDEAAIAKAQKHARWAISALNFEDVNTAIRELRGALQTLGAQ